MIQTCYLLQTKNNLYTGQGQKQEGGSKRQIINGPWNFILEAMRLYLKILGQMWHTPDVAHAKCGTHCHPSALGGGLQM